MSGASTQYSATVGSSAGGVLNDAVNAGATFPRTVHLTNTDAAETAYWGYDDTVSTSNGTPLGPGEQIVLDLIKGEQVYMIRGGSSDIDVRVADLRP